MEVPGATSPFYSDQKLHRITDNKNGNTVTTIDTMSNGGSYCITTLRRCMVLAKQTVHNAANHIDPANNDYLFVFLACQLEDESCRAMITRTPEGLVASNTTAPSNFEFNLPSMDDRFQPGSFIVDRASGSWATILNRRGVTVELDRALAAWPSDYWLLYQERRDPSSGAWSRTVRGPGMAVLVTRLALRQ